MIKLNNKRKGLPTEDKAAFKDFAEYNISKQTRAEMESASDAKANLLYCGLLDAVSALMGYSRTL